MCLKFYAYGAYSTTVQPRSGGDVSDVLGNFSIFIKVPVVKQISNFKKKFYFSLSLFFFVHHLFQLFISNIRIYVNGLISVLPF